MAEFKNHPTGIGRDSQSGVGTTSLYTPTVQASSSAQITVLGGIIDVTNEQGGSDGRAHLGDDTSGSPLWTVGAATKQEHNLPEDPYIIQAGPGNDLVLEVTKDSVTVVASVYVAEVY